MSNQRPETSNQTQDSGLWKLVSGFSESISIPESLGRIEESSQGTSGKTIIYIQDAHDSLEAQENIAKLIHYFVEQYRVKTVFEEGYEGPVPTDEYFGFIKDPPIKEKVSYFLMDKLRIGGAEYAHINRKKDFKLIGADSIKLHLENIEWYRKNAQHKEETEKDLTALQTEIAKLANRYFPKELKEWMKLKKRFDEKQIPLLDYLKRTTALVPSLRAPQSGAKQSRGFEIASSPPAPRNDAAYSNINLLLQAENTSDKEILEKVKAIDPQSLFEEVDRLENDFANQFLQNERDKKVFQYHKALDLLKRLNEIQMTPPEYEALKEHLQNLSTQELAQFIVQHTRKSIVLSKRWEDNIQKAIRFYETSQARDEAIEKALTRHSEKARRADEESQDPSATLRPQDDMHFPAILVFGGFHKERIKETLQQGGYSFLVISPKITQIDPRHQGYYKRLMSVGHHPFEVPLYVRQAARAETRFLQVKKGGAGVEMAFRSELRALSESLRQNGDRDQSHLLLQVEKGLPKIIRSEARIPSKRIEIRFPNFSAIKESRDLKYWSRQFLIYQERQSTEPKDESLLTKLGLKKGGIIWGFAGYTGEWIFALKKAGARVIYTDINPDIVKKIRQDRVKEFAGEKNDIKSLPQIEDPLKGPRHPEEVDWAFSYEPAPLGAFEWPWVMLRSLLNRKGLLWVRASASEFLDIQQWVERFALIYSLTDQELQREKVEIKAKVQGVSILTLPMLVSRLRTNSKLRRKASLDLYLLEKLQNRRNKTIRIRLPNIPILEVEESLKRIDALSSYLPEALTQKKTVFVRPPPKSQTSPPRAEVRSGTKHIAKLIGQLGILTEQANLALEEKDEWRLTDLDEKAVELLEDIDKNLRRLKGVEPPSFEIYLDALIAVHLAFPMHGTPHTIFRGKLSQEGASKLARSDLLHAFNSKRLSREQLTEKLMKYKSSLREVAVQKRLEGGAIEIIGPWRNLESFRKTQEKFPHSELSFSIFPSAKSRRSLIAFVVQGEDTAETPFMGISKAEGHTHGFSTPLEPSDADTYTAKIGATQGDTSLIVAFGDDGHVELAIYTPEVKMWIIERENQKWITQKLQELGILTSRAEVRSESERRLWAHFYEDALKKYYEAEEIATSDSLFHVYMRERVRYVGELAYLPQYREASVKELQRLFDQASNMGVRVIEAEGEDPDWYRRDVRESILKIMASHKEFQNKAIQLATDSSLQLQESIGRIVAILNGMGESNLRESKKLLNLLFSLLALSESKMKYPYQVLGKLIKIPPLRQIIERKARVFKGENRSDLLAKIMEEAVNQRDWAYAAKIMKKAHGTRFFYFDAPLILARQEQYREDVHHYIEDMPISDIGDREKKIKILVELGKIYDENGDRPMAEELWTDAFKLTEHSWYFPTLRGNDFYPERLWIRQFLPLMREKFMRFGEWERDDLLHWAEDAALRTPSSHSSFPRFVADIFHEYLKAREYQQGMAFLNRIAQKVEEEVKRPLFEPGTPAAAVTPPEVQKMIDNRSHDFYDRSLLDAGAIAVENGDIDWADRILEMAGRHIPDRMNWVADGIARALAERGQYELASRYAERSTESLRNLEEWQEFEKPNLQLVFTVSSRSLLEISEIALEKEGATNPEIRAWVKENLMKGAKRGFDGHDLMRVSSLLERYPDLLSDLEFSEWIQIIHKDIAERQIHHWLGREEVLRGFLSLLRQRNPSLVRRKAIREGMQPIANHIFFPRAEVRTVEKAGPLKDLKVIQMEYVSQGLAFRELGKEPPRQGGISESHTAAVGWAYLATDLKGFLEYAKKHEELRNQLSFQPDLQGANVLILGPGMNANEVLELMEYPGIEKIHLVDAYANDFKGIDNDLFFHLKARQERGIGTKTQFIGYLANASTRLPALKSRLKDQIDLIFISDVVDQKYFTRAQARQLVKNLILYLKPGGVLLSAGGVYRIENFDHHNPNPLIQTVGARRDPLIPIDIPDTDPDVHFYLKERDKTTTSERPARRAEVRSSEEFLKEYPDSFSITNLKGYIEEVIKSIEGPRSTSGKKSIPGLSKRLSIGKELDQGFLIYAKKNREFRLAHREGEYFRFMLGELIENAHDANPTEMIEINLTGNNNDFVVSFKNNDSISDEHLKKLRQKLEFAANVWYDREKDVLILERLDDNYGNFIRDQIQKTWADPSLPERFIREGMTEKIDEVLKRKGLIELLFIRGLTSKEDETHAGGAGIGLARIREIIQEYFNGEITIDRSDPNYTIVNLSFHADPRAEVREVWESNIRSQTTEEEEMENEAGSAPLMKDQNGVVNDQQKARNQRKNRFIHQAGLPLSSSDPDKDDQSQDPRKDVKSEKSHYFGPSFLDSFTAIPRKSTVMATPIEKTNQGLSPAAPGTKTPTTKEVNMILAPSRKKSEMTSTLSLDNIGGYSKRPEDSVKSKRGKKQRSGETESAEARRDARETVIRFQEKYAVVVDMNVFDALSEEQQIEFKKLIHARPDVKFVFNMMGERRLDPILQELMDFRDRYRNVEVRINPTSFNPSTSLRMNFQGRKVINISKEGIQAPYADFIERRLGQSKDLYRVRYREGDRNAGLLTAALLLLESKPEDFIRQGRYFSEVPVGLKADIEQFLLTYVYVGRSA